jgi:hypothetical protein
MNIKNIMITFLFMSVFLFMSICGKFYFCAKYFSMIFFHDLMAHDIPRMPYILPTFILYKNTYNTKIRFYCSQESSVNTSNTMMINHTYSVFYIIICMSSSFFWKKFKNWLQSMYPPYKEYHVSPLIIILCVSWYDVSASHQTLSCECIFSSFDLWTQIYTISPS